MSQQALLSSNSPSEGIEPLIQTKFSIPQRRTHLVPRPRLLNLLSDGMRGKLTFICAPAGYGKTTLLIDWIANCTSERDTDCSPIRWLSLDQGDNDASRFLSYLTAAFANSVAGIKNKAEALLSAFSPPSFQTILGILINELLQENKPIILVLDDYHVISNPLIHEGLAFFLEHQPDNLHLVILTRSDPAIPLARLRARGQLTELRAHDLQFTLDESTQLLNHIMSLGLSDENVTRLLDRTEGWAAGLQMAALALTNQSDRDLFLKNFSGSNRYILDFLVEEVLVHQPEAVQDFLFRTSILERLSAPLCDALRQDPTVNDAVPGQEILGYLERSNLFLVSLDSERCWYRYHHLFAGLLRARLEEKSPQLVFQLHIRASQWYEQNQLLPEAIQHALSAKDYDLACRLIQDPVEKLLGQNNMRPLVGWISQIPTDIARKHPWLCIAEAWSALFTSEAARIEPLLQSAEQNIGPENPPHLRNAWLGHIACLRAFLADIQGDVKVTMEQAQRALVTYRLENSAHRAFAKYMLGRGYFIQGAFPEAVEIFLDNISECIRMEATNIIAPSLSLLARIYRMEGRLSEADELLQNGLAHIEKWDPRRVTVAGVAYAGLADVLRERDELASAEKLAWRAVEMCEPWVNPSSMCVCYTTLVQVYQAQRKFDAAKDTLQLAEEVIRGHDPFAEAIIHLNAAKIKLWLATGQISKASQWAQDQTKGKAQTTIFSIPNERNEITLARVLIAEGKLEGALCSLDDLAKAAEAGKRYGHLIEVRNLQALALQAAGRSVQALALLQQSLALAEPEKYVRIFLDESEPMQVLLQACIRNFSHHKHNSYARRLVTAFAKSDQAIHPWVQKSDLIEPLTSREREVLQLLTEGLSNRQIAENLVLSEGTIKFHVHHVLEKLQVRTRSQAIAFARKQNIL